MDAQLAAIKAEVTRRGWDLVNICTDAGTSGKSMRGRPALAEALAAVTTGAADVLLVIKLDRLSRKLSDSVAIMERAQAEGWNLVALDLGIDLSTASGELTAHLTASVAQHEARLIGERTRAALDAKRAKGIRLGRPVTLPSEVRERIAAERALGNTMRAIADGLNHDGVATARGGSHWQSGTVAAVLASLQRDAEQTVVLASFETEAAA